MNGCRSRVSWLLALGIGGLFLAIFLYMIQQAGDPIVAFLCMPRILRRARVSDRHVLYFTVIHPLSNKFSPFPTDDLYSKTEALA